MDSALISNKILVPFTLSHSGPAKSVVQGVIIYTNSNAEKSQFSSGLNLRQICILGMSDGSHTTGICDSIYIQLLLKQHWLLMVKNTVEYILCFQTHREFICLLGYLIWD